MFELAMAWKYLIPRRRQLSVSIISLVSICVIALVVWLMLLFFSITSGVERHWISRLVAVAAPVRMTPTPSYYASYYYQVDGISLASGYRHRSLTEKRRAEEAGDPYNPTFDGEVPPSWPPPDRAADGRLRDLVGEVFALLEGLKSQFPSLRAQEYETAFATLRLRMVRSETSEKMQSAFLNQSLLIGSLDPQQVNLQDSLLPITAQDVGNLLQQFGMPLESSQEDFPSDRHSPLHVEMKEALRDFLSGVEITALQVPAGQTWDGVPSGTLIPVTFLPSSIADAHYVQQLLFQPQLSSVDASKPLSLDHLEIGRFKLHETTTPFWVTRDRLGITLPKTRFQSKWQGESILLPKAFRDAGVLIGDRGYLSYQLPSLTSVQEQRLPIYVAGFYDPGMLPMGGKLALMDPAIPSLLLSAYQAEEAPLSSGIHVHMEDFYQAEKVKQAIKDALQEQGLQAYWKVESFHDYEFTKEFLQQLRSDRHLSFVIAAIILLIACSNIISMQLLLVHDKKKEIAILRAMGASSLSIMAIFGLSGLAMGVLGSLLGTGIAFVTLYHLDEVLHLISLVQGYALFNPTFYGSKLPSELSYEGVALIWGATACLSLIAGIIPAIKASFMTTSTLLRAE